MYCWVSPAAIEAVAGEMLMDGRTAVVTDNVVDPLIPLRAAVISASPMVTPVVSSLLPGLSLIVATPASPEDQVTLLVISADP